ncbi:uncharacterized protein [Mytilus edulis]|uniref:uncharacterized protein isoform X1 n=2 Tax=Mytilus edulis TaxID=6550 RepID=UPI0039EF7867
MAGIDKMVFLPMFLIYLVGLFSYCNCYEVVGRCIKFGKDEQMYTLIGGDRKCIKENGFTYCREWACHKKCSSFNNWPGICEPCPGDTCADVGQIFDKGDFFKCADNANNCQCSNNNRVKSTRKNASVKEMCLDDLRKAAKP